MQERSIDLNAMPLDLSRPAAEQILEALRLAILEIRLEPGAKISENEVARSFGASRTPVREAFTRLREDGLVMTYPSRGTYVSKLSEAEICGAQFIREALECAVVARLSEAGLSDQDRLSIENTLIAQKTALKNDDRGAFRATDDSFHRTFAKATGINRLDAQFIREKAVLNRLRVLSLTDRAYMPALYIEHCEIYESIITRDTNKVTELMRRHLQHVLTILSGLQKTHQEYFD